MKRHIIALFIILISSYWSVRPILDGGFFPMHDDTQVGRVVAMGRALRNGQFPVRWVSDLGYGYGYPIFNFYGPLPYYAGGSLYALGVSALSATKIMFGVGVVGAGITMYFLAYPFLGSIGAITSSILYLYAPYHAVQIYVRGSVGEFWTLIFLPLLLLGVATRRSLIGAVGLAGVILSHTILGFVTTILIFASLLIRRSHFPILLLGLSLSAFFWLPAVTEMGYTSVAGQVSGTADFRDHFVCLGQLWDSVWGFGGTNQGCIDGMSFKLGKLHIILAVIGVINIFLNRKKEKKQLWLGLVALSTVLLSIFMMLPLSGFVWEIIPGFAFVQYPWRLLVYSIFGLSLLGGFGIVRAGRGVLAWLAAGVLLIAILFFNGKWFLPQYTYQKDAAHFETDEELRWRVSKISDEYLPPGIVRPFQIDRVPYQLLETRDAITLETEIDQETYKKLFIRLRRDSWVYINLADFPGWEYLVDGEKIMPTIENGLPKIHIREGLHVVELRFRDTGVRSIGNLISALALMYSIYFLSYGKKTNA